MALETSERLLWHAVIQQALFDLANAPGRKSADKLNRRQVDKWFFNPMFRNDFTLVADFAGVEASRLERIARRMRNTLSVTEGRKAKRAVVGAACVAVVRAAQ